MAWKRQEVEESVQVGVSMEEALVDRSELWTLIGLLPV